MKKNYCLISHTHWDREWYLPFENFRIRLVDLIDNLLDILEKDANYRFHLDAQTIVLEDYLEIRPHKRAVLEGHIKNGRILVGPWYVQNDFHLTSGEATVRNLMIGTKIAKSFGNSMPIGYAADQFGLIAQLPQIIRGFGLTEGVFGRGIDRHVTEFFWESEDGSKILCKHMCFWYNNAQRLPENVNGTLGLLRNCGEMCAARAVDSNYLLMNGVDHLEAQENLSAVLDAVRPYLNEDEAVFQDTLPELIARMKKEVAENGIELPTFRGEFRDNGANNVLTGTLSSRVYMKRANVKTQTALEKQIEPLYALLATEGVKGYPHDYMTYLWKLLIQNHPHDSICGCSVDAVHRHMMDRFERLEENTSDLITRGVELLNSHIERGDLTDRDYRVLLLNGTQWSDGTSVKAVADIPVNEDTGAFVILDEAGKECPFVVEEIRRNVGKRILSPINLPGEKRVNRYTIRIDAGKTEGVGYRTLLLRPVEGALAEGMTVGGDPYMMENESLAVRILPDGRVDLTDKRNGAVYRGILGLEDTADRGESYIFMPGDPMTNVSSEGIDAKVEILAENRMESRRKVSYTLNVQREEGSGTVDVEMILSLDRKGDAFGVAIKLNNQTIRHRLRLLLPTDLKTETNYAGQPFDCIVRNKVSVYDNDTDHPNTDYVGVEDGERGIAILQEGLYEYEQCTDERNTLALTLLRSTGRITDTYENEANMTEGWTSPEGFCLGIHESRLAIVPYAGSHVDAAIPARSQGFLSPVKAVVCPVDYNKFVGGRPFVQASDIPDIFYRPLENAHRVLAPAARFLTLTSKVKDAMILSALKGAEDGRGLIVRVFNSTSEEMPFTATFPREIASADLVNLNEEYVDFLAVENGHGVSLTAKPKQIVTLRIVFR